MRLSIIVTLLALGACTKPAPAPDQPAQRAEESADPLEIELARDPQRLKALRRQCRIDRQAAGAETCDAVSRATRRRFMNQGPSAYAPGVVSGKNGGLAPRPHSSRPDA